MYSATKEFRFEMAHVLTNYNGLCGNLHGHSYRCLVTLSSDTLENGMVMDFSVVKELVNKEVLSNLDHACAFNTLSDDVFENDLRALCKKHNKRIVEFPFRTTAENMVKWIYDKINAEIIKAETIGKITPMFIKCSRVELYETTTGHATYEE